MLGIGGKEVEWVAMGLGLELVSIRMGFILFLCLHFDLTFYSPML